MTLIPTDGPKPHTPRQTGGALPPRRKPLSAAAPPPAVSPPQSQLRRPKGTSPVPLAPSAFPFGPFPLGKTPLGPASSPPLVGADSPPQSPSAAAANPALQGALSLLTCRKSFLELLLRSPLALVELQRTLKHLTLGRIFWKDVFHVPLLRAAPQNPDEAPSHQISTQKISSVVSELQEQCELLLNGMRAASSTQPSDESSQRALDKLLTLLQKYRLSSQAMRRTTEALLTFHRSQLLPETPHAATWAALELASPEPFSARVHQMEDLLKTFLKERNSLVEKNMGLVHKMSSWYARQMPSLSKDIAQEGAIGLIRAVELYEPSFDTKLTTYASWWVRQTITRFLAEKARFVHLPVYVTEILKKVRRTQRELKISRHKKVSEIEAAQELGIGTTKMEQILVHTHLSEVVVESSLVSTSHPDLHPLEMAEGQCVPSPYEAFARKELEQHLTKLLLKFGERHAHIIRSRFGLDADDEQTLESIGERLGITRERVRQIESKVLSHLKEKPHFASLKDFWETEPGSEGEEGQLSLGHSNRPALLN